MILQMMVLRLLGSWFLFDSAGRFVYAEFSWHDVRFSLACVYSPSRNPDRDAFFQLEKIGHTETSERNDGGLRTEAAVVDAGVMEFQCCDQGYLLSFHTPQADPADTNIFV